MKIRPHSLSSLFLLAACGMAGGVSAAIVQESDGTYDWQYDDVSHLQWLDLTYTDGLSLSEAISSYSADGWTVATEAQFHFMYHSNYDNPANNDVFGFTEGFDPNPPEGQGAHSVSGQNMFGAGFVNAFAADFGITASGSQQGFSFSNTYGFYLDGAALRMGGVFQSVLLQGADTTDKIVSYYDYFPDYNDLFYDAEAFGVYMVRDVSAIPLPAGGWLFLSAVGVLTGLRRKAQGS